MGVGIIELVDGKKQYNEYAGGENLMRNQNIST